MPSGPTAQGPSPPPDPSGRPPPCGSYAVAGSAGVLTRRWRFGYRAPRMRVRPPALVRPQAHTIREVRVLPGPSCEARNQRKLRRRETGWGAPGGERPVRRMTNAIRPGAVASLRAKGEAPTGVGLKFSALRGSEEKGRSEASSGWRQNGRKAVCVKRGGLRRSRGAVFTLPAVEPKSRSRRIQSVHSSEEAP